MVISVLERAVSEARSGFDVCLTGFDELAVSLIAAPSMRLSRVLVGTILVGDQQPGESALCACRALELLDQALLLGRPKIDDGCVREDELLVADYLYARSIDQVIEADEPKVIGMLAGAIMKISEYRVINSAFTDPHRALIAAALEIGRWLGKLDGSAAGAVGAAIRESRAENSTGWIEIFPSGPVRDHFNQVLGPALAVRG